MPDTLDTLRNGKKKSPSGHYSTIDLGADVGKQLEQYMRDHQISNPSTALRELVKAGLSLDVQSILSERTKQYIIGVREHVALRLDGLVRMECLKIIQEAERMSHF